MKKHHMAQYPNTPPEKLAELAEDEDEDVRWYVAGNLKTPPHILTNLSKDSVPICWMVARNPNTPPETLISLVQNGIPDIREMALENPNCPIELKVEYILSA